MPVQVTELIEQADLLFAEAKSILSGDHNEDGSVTPDDLERAQAMIEDARKLKGRAVSLTELDDEVKNVQAIIAEQETAEDRHQAEVRSEFTDWSGFLQAIGRYSATGRIDPRLKAFRDLSEPGERKDLNEGDGSAGGFLVPSEFQAQLLAIMGEESIVRSRATVIRMRRRQLQIPVLDQTDTTAGKPAWFGGMQAYWAEEAAEKSQTDPAFRQITLTAHKLVMYTRASDELLDDSAISLSDFLAGPMGFAGAIAWYEDYAFIQGNGAGQPYGILNAPARILYDRATNNQITYPDLANMMQRFLPSGQGVWIVSQSALGQLLTMNGPAGNASYLWGSAVTGAPNTLLGLPVILTEKAPALGLRGDVMLADFRYYLVGDRQSTTVESTKFDRWRYDQTSWRAVHRVDGQPWLSTPITLQDGSTQISPFVVLDEPTGS